MNTPLIRVDNVHVRFPAGRQGLLGKRTYVHAVAGVSFDIQEGETVGLVGESGCGKSTLGRVLLHLIAKGTANVDGRVLYNGQDLLTLSGRHMRLRRRDLAMVFQNPLTSLNPRMTAGGNIAVPLENFGYDTAAKERRIRELLELVGLKQEMANRFPGAFSGGQRQRIGIARALALKPRFVVCDEPLASLDVSIQAQILNLLSRLKRDLGLTLLFISHDLRAVRHISDRIIVMYLGRVVEIGTYDQIVADPKHPYTKALVSAIPRADAEEQHERILLTGELPSPKNPPSGCVFRTRCQSPLRNTTCEQQVPKLRQIGDRLVACDRLES